MTLFDGKTRVPARALAVAQRIDLRAFERSRRLASAPLLVGAGASGCAALFRYGVVVCMGLDAVEEVAFLEGLRHLLVDPCAHQESEEVDLVIDPAANEGISEGTVVLNAPTVERLQLVADVLAKSVILAYYEAELAAGFDRIEPLAVSLREGARSGSHTRELLRHIGDSLLIEGRMVGRAEIADKPDVLWEHPEFERLYLRLHEEYELRDRHAALERKLGLVSRTAATMLELSQYRRTLRVEWYIVVLILFEILLSLYELFLRPAA